MDPSPKILLVIVFTAIAHVHGFAQHESARTVFTSAVSEISRNPEKAFQLLTDAMDLARQGGDWDTYVKSLNQLASLAIESDEQREKVFPLLKNAFTILKDFENGNDLAELHYNIAEYYNRSTIQIDTPIFHYKEALSIWNKSKGEWSAEVSDCYHGLGNIYKYYKFDFYEAEKCYEYALTIREKIGFTDSLKLYRNYYSLAATNRSQFDFEKAVSYGSKTLEVAKKLEPRRLELAHGMVANIYRDMQNSDLAKEHYLTALELNSKTKDLDQRAWYYLSLGETYKNDSIFENARQYFDKAYNLYKTTDGAKDPELFLHLLINMMETFSMIDDAKSFERIRKEVFRELVALDRLASERASQVWEEVGDHHFRKQMFDSAIFCYQEGLQAAVKGFKSEEISDNPTEQQIGFNYYVHELLTKKASAINEKFRLSNDHRLLVESLDCLKFAEKLISLQRNSLDLEVAKWAFLDQRFDLYEDILATLQKGENSFPRDTIHKLAFRYLEQSKARSLADALTQAEFSGRITEEDSLFRFLNELKRQLFSTQDLINKTVSAATDSEKLVELRENVVKLDRMIQSCKAAIEQNHPGYFKAKYGYKNPSITALQKALQAKQQVLIEFFWGNEAVYAMGIGDSQVIFRRIGSVDSIATTIDNLLSHLNGEQSAAAFERYDKFATSAFLLYKVLINPFADLLKDRKRIQIIPDGMISQVPFEILVEEKLNTAHVNYLDLKYLIRSYAIGYAYSSSMLVEQKREQTSQPSLLAVGFTPGTVSRDARFSLQDIEGARQELNALRVRFEKGKFLTEEMATESNFKSMASEVDIIHLAVHGRGDVQNDFAASLYFTNPRGTPDDGELHAYELYGLKFKALMAVLSSCESGLGKGYKGEGMISMASAFAFSGCQNTLMSLWMVNDQASVKLIDDFYGHFLEGETIDEALRKSKLGYLETADELTADPKIWAPLVAYGSLDGIQKNDKRIIFMAIGALAILTILFLSLKRFRRSGPKTFN